MVFLPSVSLPDDPTLISFSSKEVSFYWQKQPSEVFLKKVSLKIAQIAQENTCVAVPF